jgi:hypothetical protein
MSAREVTAAELKAKLSPDLQRKVDSDLAAGYGVALFVAENLGGPRHVSSYGVRGAEISGMPPASYGGADLAEYCPPQKNAQPMVSPLFAAVGGGQQGPPQITRPRTSQPHTEYPEVRIEGRTSSHPRGSAGDAGFITPGRPVPEDDYVEPPSYEPGSSAAWWAARLGLR